MSATTQALPPQFAELERFVPRWAEASFNDRLNVRGIVPMTEITEFYDACIGRAQDMLDYVSGYPIGSDLPAEAASVFRLLLGLVHASVSVEIQGQPLPPKTTYPLGVKVVSGLTPFGSI